MCAVSWLFLEMYQVCFLFCTLLETFRSGRMPLHDPMLCLYCTHMLGGHKHLHGCWTSRIHSPGPRHLANLWCIVGDFWFCHVIRILQLPTSLSTWFDLWIRPVEDVPLDDEDPGETRRPRVSYVWCVSYPKSWWQTWRGKSWHSRTLQSTSLDLKKEN